GPDDRRRVGARSNNKRAGQHRAGRNRASLLPPRITVARLRRQYTSVLPAAGRDQRAVRCRRRNPRRCSREKELIMFDDLLSRLGIKPVNSGVYAGRWIEQPGGDECVSLNPANGQKLAVARGASQKTYDAAVESAAAEFKKWRTTPPP